MSAATPGVRHQSIRVALAATGVVAAVYLLVAAAVITYATVDLTRQVDARVTGALGRLPPPENRQPNDPFDPGRDPTRPLAPRNYVWTITPDGRVLSLAGTPELPQAFRDVTAPVTATIDGTELRIAGRPVGTYRVIVAEALDQVKDAQATILVAEILIAPFLLVVVFLGAVLIGRRVAAPIEASRRRQMEFTADASHELRTPLSVIEAHASLALAQDRDGGWYRTAFERVDRESRRMRTLLEDMLWLARFDAGHPAGGNEPVDLGTIARQAADRFSAIAEARNVTLALTIPDRPVTIAASVDLVDRLIGVLVDNACKYVPEGGRVEVQVSLAGGRASVTIDDSGPGIRAEDRGRIFDRFHRAVDTAGSSGGAGLGLAIGDAIVRATGGRWLVDTSPLGGARFAVSWPAVTLGQG